MDIDIMIKNARNVHIEEMGTNVKRAIKFQINLTIKDRNERAKQPNNEYFIELANAYIDGMLKAIDVIDSYVKLEKR